MLIDTLVQRYRMQALLTKSEVVSPTTNADICIRSKPPFPFSAFVSTLPPPSVWTSFTDEPLVQRFCHEMFFLTPTSRNTQFLHAILNQILRKETSLPLCQYQMNAIQTLKMICNDFLVVKVNCP